MTNKFYKSDLAIFLGALIFMCKRWLITAEAS